MIGTNTYIYCLKCGQSYPQGYYHLCPMDLWQAWQPKYIYTTSINTNPMIEDLLERIAIALEKIANRP